MVPLETDTRGVAGVIGAVLIFGIVVVAFSTYQATSIPAQNEEIEAGHYATVQDDLIELQSALVTTAESGSSRSVPVDLGPTYPSRLFAVNGPPPAGRLATETTGGGEITSSNVPLNRICRLEAGSTNAVPTRAVQYQPGYRYFRGGDVPHRLEETLLYQAARDDGTGATVVRTGQSVVDPVGRTVTLYPVQGSVRASGTRAAVVRLRGGYGRSVSVTDASVVLPTRAPVSVWRDQVAADNPDVSVSVAGTDRVEITAAGNWTVRCRPVGVAGTPDQLPTAEAGENTTVVEGRSAALDGTGSQPVSTIEGYAWSFVGTQPSGVSLDGASSPRATLDASGADVSGPTPVELALQVTDGDGNTDTDRVTVTVTSAGSGGDGGATPGLTGTAESLQTGAAVTQNFTFTPTEATIPGGTTIALDLSGAEGGTSGNPDAVYYGDGSKLANFTGSFNTVTGSGTYIVEFTPSANVAVDRTVQIQFTNVKTQSTPESGIGVPISRADGGSVTTTFDLADDPSNGGGGDGSDGGSGGGSDAAQNVVISQVQIDNGDVDVRFRNNNPSGVRIARARLDSYSEASPPNNKNKDPIDRLLYSGGSGPALDEGDPLESVSGPTISNGGTEGVILSPRRLQTKSAKYETADAQSGDQFLLTVEFDDGSTKQYSISL